MKHFNLKTLFFLFLLIGNKQVWSQLLLDQNFTSGGAGWVISNGSSIGVYQDGGNGCINNTGILTPGVDANNPAKILSETITPTLQHLTVQFSIWRYNANLTCSSRSNFGCNTYVDILLVSSAYNGTDPIGDGAIIYANYSNYLLPIAGGIVTLNVANQYSLPQFKMFFNFTSPGNCIQPGTKYVLDDFKLTENLQPCIYSSTCPPVTNNDYFKAETQGFMTTTLLGNVYGTNIGFTPPASHINNVTRSLTNSLYATNGGVDFDFDNHPLITMTFTLLTTDFTPAEATLVFNSDGTFNFTKLNQLRSFYRFTYRLTEFCGNFQDAVVTIDYSFPSTLPVNLLYFTAMKQDKAVQLKWATAIETDNAGFTVERMQQGVFTPIQFIASKAVNGNSNHTLNYSYTDNSYLLSGIVHYRLKQTDKNGLVQYTEIRTVKFNNTFEITAYPNPSTGYINIMIPDDAGGVDISILDLNGKAVQQLKNTLLRKVTFRNLETGIYIIKVKTINSNKTYAQKLIVK